MGMLNGGFLRERVLANSLVQAGRTALAKRSMWTGRRSEELIEVRLPGVTRFGTPTTEVESFWVETEHEQQLRAYVEYARRWGRTFLALVLSGTAVSLVASLLIASWPPARWIVTGALLVLAATIVVFPFPTPETVALFGIRRSVVLGRVGGGLVAAVAIWSAIVAA